jgi:hypothetical protein
MVGAEGLSPNKRLLSLSKTRECRDNIKESSDRPKIHHDISAVLASLPVTVEQQMMDVYTREFYGDLATLSEAAADVIVPILLLMFPARSVVDIGCGTGAWLRAFERTSKRPASAAKLARRSAAWRAAIV